MLYQAERPVALQKHASVNQAWRCCTLLPQAQAQQREA